MKTKIAQYISAAGHPFFTYPLFLLMVLFRNFELRTAVITSVLIIGGIIVPLSIRMYRGVRKGTYADFDLSDQLQRKRWYPFATVLVFLVTALLFITRQPDVIRYNMLLGWLLLIVSQLSNYFIKTSLHTAFSVFLAFLLFSVHELIGILFLCFTPFIAWSRYHLKRHTLNEIIAGALIGLIFGYTSLFVVSNYRNDAFDFL